MKLICLDCPRRYDGQHVSFEPGDEPFKVHTDNHPRHAVVAIYEAAPAIEVPVAPKPTVQQPVSQPAVSHKPTALELALARKPGA